MMGRVRRSTLEAEVVRELGRHGVFRGVNGVLVYCRCGLWVSDASQVEEGSVPPGFIEHVASELVDDVLVRGLVR